MFGYITTLDALAGGDITKYDYILNLPYNEYFVKLVLNKSVHKYQDKLRTLQQKD